MPRKKRKKLLLKNNAAEVYIYDDIGKYWGFSATELIEFLQQAGKTADVVVHINSYGGEVYEGIAIYNALLAHKGKVTTIVEGVAASMASLIFLAGDERKIYDNSFLMIHNPLFEHLEGNREEIQKELERLGQVEEMINSIYTNRTGNSEDKVITWLKEETWFTAAEAVANNFATEVIEAEEVDASANLESLVAHYHKRKITMEFAEWLKNYCEPLGLDVKKLTTAQKRKLKARFQEQQKAKNEPPKDAAPAKDPPTDPPSLSLPEDKLREYRKQLAEENERVETINSLALKFADNKLDAEYVKELGTRATTSRGLAAHAIKEGWTADQFELHLLRAKIQDVSNIGIHKTKTISELPTKAISAALCRKAGVPANKVHKWTGEKWGYENWFSEQELDDSDNPQIRDIGLHQMYDLAIQAAFGHHSQHRYGTNAFINQAREALWKIKMEGNTSWTGLNIFEDAANKMLWAAYEAQETTWQEWVSTVSVSDFKTYNMYRMTMKGGYNKVGADGELKHGGFTDDKYTVSANTFGKIVGLSRRDIINDDLGALNRIMSSLGTEGARFLEELFYGYFLNVRDTLFPAAGTYNNYMDGASSALGVDSLTTAEQKFADQVDADNAPLLVNSELILVGTSLSIIANEIYKQISLDVLQTANSKGRPNQNPHVGKWRPVVSPYINNTNIKQRTDALGSVGSAIPNQSSTQWWLLPRPNIAVGSIIVGAFLNGQQRPVIEQGDPAFDVLGLQWRAYHDAGVGSGDPKLAVYSKGAA